MIQSIEGLEFLKLRESCRLKAYKDQAGVWTIGYGTTRYYPMGKIIEGDIIDQNRADSLLMMECDGIGRKIEDLLNVKLKQCQYDALISFIYNVGMTAFKNSTLRILINQNSEEDKIREQFMRWSKIHRDGALIVSNGLRFRRKRESDLYFSC